MDRLFYIERVKNCQTLHELNMWVRNGFTAVSGEDIAGTDLDEIIKVAEARQAEIIKDKLKYQLSYGN